MPPQKVFTVFNIGTGHNFLEPYNILVRLWQKTDAAKAKPWREALAVKDRNDTAEEPGWDKADQVRLINDGPSSHLDKPGGYGADAPFYYGLDEMAWHTVNLIKQHGSTTVNMVGHSRGAIMCVIIANRLRKAVPGARCNLFLIDPVNKSAFTKEEARTVYGTVDSCQRILMEDDDSPKFFPLQEIWKDGSGNKQLVLENNIRLPGTHGTATQCNPLLVEENALKNKPRIPPVPPYIPRPPIGSAAVSAAIRSSPRAPVWPIGGVAEKIILQWLQLQGTRLKSSPPSDEQILNEYSRIIQCNPGFPDTRWVNDVAICYPNAEQKYKVVFAQRVGKDLDMYAKNPYRYSNYFVNQQHADLFKKKYTELFNTIDDALRKKNSPLPTIESLPQGDLGKLRTEIPVAYENLVRLLTTQRR